MRVALYVRPGSSVTAVGGEFDDALVVRVREAAEHGRATDAALAALASELGLPRRSIALVRGASSRRKLVELDSDQGADLEAAIIALRRRA